MQRIFKAVVTLCLGVALMGAVVQDEPQKPQKPAEPQEQKVMSSDALASFPNPKPSKRIAYGDGPLQFGELWLPEQGKIKPRATVFFIHGGCWYSAYDIAHTRFLASEMAKAGYAVWSVEYRRIGDEGGGWPGTFQDIAAAGDYLKKIAADYGLDMDNVVASGHSAGGHLALWFADRPHGFKNKDSLIPRAVLALAPAADLTYLAQQKTCGSAAEKLLGGLPDALPEVYKQADTALRPLRGVPQTIMVGKLDTVWTPVAMRYARVLTQAGIQHSVLVAPRAGHFELIKPQGSTWALLKAELKRLTAASKKDQK